jgi:hypothetical protein
MDYIRFIEFELLVFAEIIKQAYIYVFPEYPAVGIIVVGLSILILLIYIFKANFLQAVKVSFSVFFILTFVLLVLHHLSKILHLNSLLL